MSAEHNELQDSARRALTGAGLAAGEDKTWPLVVDLGWLFVAVPEELGGLGQGLAGACAIYTESGRSLAAAPYLPAMLAIEAVSGSAMAQREHWIERLTTGDYAAASLADSKLTLSGKSRVSGTIAAVQAADTASHVLISTPELAALAPLKQAGVERVRRQPWDLTRRLFDVRLTNVEIDDGLVLARGAEARALAERVATHRDFALAAECVGASEALLEMTVEYLKTRRQYGRPLAMFQALKHRCADLKMQVSTAQALLLDSLARLDADDAEPALLGKMAKQLAAATYFKVAEEAIQMHGGIAMTKEHVCHLFVKRALLNQQLGQRIDTYELDIAAGVLGA